MDFISNQNFKDLDFSQECLSVSEFELCSFKNCTFSGRMLAEHRFLECEFIDCDLSNVNLSQVAFQDVVFKKCKMLGLQFNDCNTFAFSAEFQECNLEHSSFYQMDLTSCRFDECSMKDVDLSAADMSKIEMNTCDFQSASFDHTNLEKSDLINSYNYNIDPNSNRIEGAKFSRDTLAGLLNSFGIIIE